MDFQRADVRNQACAAIGEGDLLAVALLLSELDFDVLGNAHVNRAGVGEGFHIDTLEFGITRIF